MHTIRANLYWEFQFVLGYIAVPRSRILLEPLYGSGVAPGYSVSPNTVMVLVTDLTTPCSHLRLGEVALAAWNAAVCASCQEAVAAWACRQGFSSFAH